MIINENRLFRYMDIGFYLIFIPIFLLLIPADHLIERDVYFFALLTVYMAVIHHINRQENPISLLLSSDYKKSAAVMLLTLTIAFLFTRMEMLDIRGYNALSNNPHRSTEIKVRSIWMLYFVEFCFSTMTALALEIVRQIKVRAQLEEEKSRAELSLYKSQINPHFMLNTLNTLYGLHVTKSERMGELFLKFADMIKYTFSNSDKERVMVCDEMKYLSEYIDLHSLRLGDQTTVNFSCDIDDETLMLPPMMLITFVENAFKYGVSSSQRSEINISVSLKKRKFHFSTENRIFSRGEGSTGIGLKNCQKRLELLYPTSHTLSYGEVQGMNVFRTNLKIVL